MRAERRFGRPPCSKSSSPGGRPTLGVLMLGLCSWMLCACGGAPVVTTFPDGLRPLLVDLAVWPQAEQDEPWPQRFELAAEQQDGIYRAQLRGYVHASLESVVAALSEPAVVSNRRRLSEYSVSYGVEPGYELSFRTHNVVHQIITVRFDVTWRQGALRAGDERVGWLAVYQKTDGTSYVSLLQGSLVATELGPSRIGVELVTELSAMQSSTDDVRQHLEDVWANLLAHCAGQALPSFD